MTVQSHETCTCHFRLFPFKEQTEMTQRAFQISEDRSKIMQSVSQSRSQVLSFPHPRRYERRNTLKTSLSVPVRKNIYPALRARKSVWTMTQFIGFGLTPWIFIVHKICKIILISTKSFENRRKPKERNSGSPRFTDLTLWVIWPPGSLRNRSICLILHARTTRQGCENQQETEASWLGN